MRLVRPLALILLSLFTISILASTVNAWSITQSLPSNTIMFEDFSNASKSWHVADTCAGGANASRNTTVAFPGDAASLWQQCLTSSGVTDSHWSFGFYGDLVGVSVWQTGGTLIMNDTASSGVSSISNEYWDVSNHWEGKLEYNPRLCTWSWLWGGPGTGDSTTTTVLIKECVPVENQTAGPTTPQISFAWVYVKMIVNQATNKYVSICIAFQCFSASDLRAISGGAGDEIRSISAAGAGWVPKLWSDAEISTAAGTTTVDNSFHYARLLITNESPGSPTIQFGISLFSAWFPVLMASVGALYGTSGIGLARRVILGKTEGLLQSQKMIFLTGLIATIGFIVILALGALLTQQVCQNTHGATCSY